MAVDVHIRPARTGDFPQAAALLASESLPLDGLKESFSNALIAEDRSTVVGCVALERYGDVGLLRSLVVSRSRRGQLLGEKLTAEALRLARERGIRDLYLLTETAAGFFPRFGFEVEDRASAPPSLAKSAEFRSACPASAVMMHARLERP